MAGLWILVALLLAVAGAILIAWSRRQRLRTGLPLGEVVYADTGTWRRCTAPLFSARYGLAGKPDYLIREDGRIVPVEVKPGRDVAEPYESDILQLAAYCVLVEETFGAQPPYGYLQYRRRTFRIEYSRQVREQLQSTLQHMRHDMGGRDVAPSHEEPRRCLHCGHRQHCEKQLA